MRTKNRNTLSLLGGLFLSLAIKAQATLTFFAGTTDPPYDQPWPDQLMLSLQIYNGAHCIFSANPNAEQTGINSFNFTSTDLFHKYCLDNHLVESLTIAYIAGDSEAEFSGMDGPTVVQWVTNWLQAVSQRLAGTTLYLNFANEAVLHHDAGSGPFSTAFGGAGASGYDWLINLGHLVRKYFPAAHLGINDFNWESPGNDLPYNVINHSGPSQLPQWLNAIKILKTAGVIDWVGGEGYSLETVSSANLTAAINAVGALGVRVIFTEFSPDAYQGGSVDPNKVAQDWMRLFPLLYQNSFVEAVIGPWDYRWSNTQGGGVAGSQFLVDDRQNPPVIEPTVAYLRSVIKDAVGATPSPTPTPSVSPSASPSPTVSPSPSSSPSATPTPVPSTSPTPPLPTPTPTPIGPPTPTPVGTPTPSPSRAPAERLTYHRWEHMLDHWVKTHPPVPDPFDSD